MGVPALLALFGAVFAVIGSDRWRAPALGFLVGAALFVVLTAVVWTVGSGCAAQGPDGRIVEVECGTGVPVNRWVPLHDAHSSAEADVLGRDGDDHRQ